MSRAGDTSTASPKTNTNEAVGPEQGSALGRELRSLCLTKHAVSIYNDLKKSNKTTEDLANKVEERANSICEDIIATEVGKRADESLAATTKKVVDCFVSLHDKEEACRHSVISLFILKLLQLSFRLFPPTLFFRWSVDIALTFTELALALTKDFVRSGPTDAQYFFTLNYYLAKFIAIFFVIPYFSYQFYILDAISRLNHRLAGMDYGDKKQDHNTPARPASTTGNRNTPARMRELKSEEWLADAVLNRVVCQLLDTFVLGLYLETIGITRKFDMFRRLQKGLKGDRRIFTVRENGVSRGLELMMNDIRRFVDGDLPPYLNLYYTYHEEDDPDYEPQERSEDSLEYTADDLDTTYDNDGNGQKNGTGHTKRGKKVMTGPSRRRRRNTGTHEEQEAQPSTAGRQHAEPSQKQELTETAPVKEIECKEEKSEPVKGQKETYLQETVKEAKTDCAETDRVEQNKNLTLSPLKRQQRQAFISCVEKVINPEFAKKLADCLEWTDLNTDGIERATSLLTKIQDEEELLGASADFAISEATARYIESRNSMKTPIEDDEIDPDIAALLASNTPLDTVSVRAGVGPAVLTSSPGVAFIHGIDDEDMINLDPADMPLPPSPAPDMSPLGKTRRQTWKSQRSGWTVHAVDTIDEEEEPGIKGETKGGKSKVPVTDSSEQGNVQTEKKYEVATKSSGEKDETSATHVKVEEMSDPEFVTGTTVQPLSPSSASSNTHSAMNETECLESVNENSKTNDGSEYLSSVEPLKDAKSKEVNQMNPGTRDTSAMATTQDTDVRAARTDSEARAIGKDIVQANAQVDDVQAVGKDTGPQATGEDIRAQTTEKEVSSKTTKQDAHMHAIGKDTSAQSVGKETAAQANEKDIGAHTTKKGSYAHAAVKNPNVQMAGKNNSAQTVGKTTGLQATGKDTFAHTTAQDAYAQSATQDANALATEKDTSAQTIAQDANAQSATQDANALATEKNTSGQTTAQDANAQSATQDAIALATEKDTSAETTAQDANAQCDALATEKDTSAETTVQNANAQSATQDTNAQSATQDANAQSATQDANAQSATQDANAQSATQDANAQSATQDANTLATEKDTSAQTTSQDANAQTTSQDANAQSATQDANALATEKDTSAQTTTQDANAQSATQDANAQSATQDANTLATEKDTSAQTTSQDANAQSATQDANAQSATQDANAQSATQDANNLATGKEGSTQATACGMPIHRTPDEVNTQATHLTNTSGDALGLKIALTSESVRSPPKLQVLSESVSSPCTSLSSMSSFDENDSKANIDAHRLSMNSDKSLEGKDAENHNTSSTDVDTGITSTVQGLP
ncbi:serine-rich adhesin for platelets-like [Elysia marginata]|uniref:Serine-rich adhesin for platelets-like n=1 Tax=Elysia marginata TaxID=1093978 RepID=A0AAV4IZI7_9GAST|nr:serine-rich adhesin for platelets-like [Elysia marginata]